MGFSCKTPVLNQKHVRMDVEISLGLIVKSNISRCTLSGSKIFNYKR